MLEQYVAGAAIADTVGHVEAFAAAIDQLLNSCFIVLQIGIDGDVGITSCMKQPG